MRDLVVSHICGAAAQLCIAANRELPDDSRRTLNNALVRECWPRAQRILCGLVRSHTLAHDEQAGVPVSLSRQAGADHRRPALRRGGRGRPDRS